MSISDPTFTEEAGEEMLVGEVSVEEIAASQIIEEASADVPVAGNGDTAAATPPIPPFPPIPILKRPVSGRYRGNLGGFQLELRVDVDRTRPMKRVSGDFFQIVGGTTNYFGSFVVNSPTITVTPTLVTIKGLGNYTFAAGAPVVQVKIPRRTLFQPQAPATVQFFTVAGAPGATYTCAFESVYFRTLRIETDRVSDVVTPVFNAYNTGALPSGGPARNLSVVGAYAEAGLQIVPTAGNNVVDIIEAQAGAKWSNAEMHASMVRHFTLWKELPQWAVWLIVAQDHDFGPGLYGIMFDQAGKQRQGCAVFHRGIGGITNEKQRLQLYTYVHELGHCFNLLHSWQKSFAVPPVANRPLSLSWMNYPFTYPDGGEPNYWAKFPFQFDNEEVIHLRHAFRNNIVMGGNNFIIGSGLGKEVMADPVRDDSGLKLTISTHKPKFALGEPVVLELALETADNRARRVHPWLHPNCGLVKVAIEKPNGVVLAYEPMIDHIVGEGERDLIPTDKIADSAYIGFGKAGFYFDQPGNYRIRASYAALDGSEVLSEVLTVRVRYPVTAADEELADLFMGEDQGNLLYLLGSDSDYLRNGNDAFIKVVEKYPKSEMSDYARLVLGTNAGRTFKTIADDNINRVNVRQPQAEESAQLLSAVVSSGTLDPVSTQQTMEHLAAVQSTGGDTKAAKKTRDALAAMSGKATKAAGK